MNPDFWQKMLATSASALLDSGQKTVPCKMSDLWFEKRLDSFEPKTKFRIVSFYKYKYNSLHIMPVEMEDCEFRLCEEILDIAEDKDLFLGRAPEIKEVVLAPRKDRYHRGIVMKKVGKKQVEVYLFDVGGFVVVKIAKLKPLNELIKQYPVLSYHVVLDEFADTSHLFFASSFEFLMNNMQKKEYLVELTKTLSDFELNDPICKMVNRKRVKLFYEVRKKKVSLLEIILNLKVWEWERSSNLVGTDVDVCLNGAYGYNFQKPYEFKSIRYLQLAIGTKFTAMVSRVKPLHLARGRGSQINLVLLDIPTHLNIFDVLHTQMLRYTRTIEASPFEPAYLEAVMFKLNNTSHCRAKIRNKWLRGVRRDHLIHLVDMDDFIPYVHLPKEDYEMRRLYGEFLEVPVLGAAVFPVFKGGILPFLLAQRMFEENKRYAFKIVKAVEGGFYEATFDPEPTG